MILKEIHIHNVRNIEKAKIEFGDHLNILYGENGSGKSSVLESIYLLSSGKSFRSRHITKIITENKNKLTLFGKLSSKDKTTTLGIEKSSSGHIIHINGEGVKKVSALALSLPVLIVTQDSHKLLEAGPQWRRQFSDWGLFHVKHDFLLVWTSYRKLLKSRNQALLNKATRAEIDAWNEGLASFGETYNILRRDYINEICPWFKEYAQSLLGNHGCKSDFELKYRQGWPKDINLYDCLKGQYERDRISGRTPYGPHRADMIVNMNGRDAKDQASRGQQKLLVYALYLAQIAHLRKESGKETFLLLDDLGAELDINHSLNLLKLISEQFSQVCMTTANLDSLPLDQFKEVKMFHVEHGKIQSVSH